MDLLDLYAFTLPILSTETLIMGLSLWLIYGNRRMQSPNQKLAMRLFSIAMFMIALINIGEMFMDNHFGSDQLTTLSVVILASAIQLFLILSAYATLMNFDFLTRRRVFIELLLIVIFTLPPLFVNTAIHPTLFYVLFYISLCFYLIKYVLNIMIYKRFYNITQTKLRDYYSDDAANRLNWIQTTFYVILILGAVSALVPLTNYIVLILYQLFLFFTYFYLYFMLIRHESMFCDLTNLSSDAPTERDSRGSSCSLHDKVIFENWIAERHYAKPGITIEDVATQLNTNRTTLSLYINSELELNFYDWISTIRIEEARYQLIANPSLPIIEIAAYVGVEDRSNFDKLFKRMLGMSPAAYRINYAHGKLKKSAEPQGAASTPQAGSSGR